MLKVIVRSALLPALQLRYSVKLLHLLPLEASNVSEVDVAKPLMLVNLIDCGATRNVNHQNALQQIEKLARVVFLGHQLEFSLQNTVIQELYVLRLKGNPTECEQIQKHAQASDVGLVANLALCLNHFGG